MADIREMKPKCQKLLMNPTACHGCEHSPLKEVSETGKEALQIYSGMIGTVAAMVDAAKFGWIKGDDVTPLEFSMMRAYEAALQSRRAF